MQQLLLQKIQKFSDMFDDAIKTGRLMQKSGGVGSDNKACAMGVIAVYSGAPGDDALSRITHLQANPIFDMNNTFYFTSVGGADGFVNSIKKGWEKEGKIRHYAVAALNDKCGWTFAQFRDLFREMGI